MSQLFETISGMHFLYFIPHLWNNCDITKLFQRHKTGRATQSGIDFPIAL